ncbi:MAG: hypothetical protein ACKOHK_13750 [Planctomycetia bacterium]
MTQPATVRRSDLPDRLRKKLEELEPRVHGVLAAMAVWTRELSDAERKSLGDDAYTAWKQHGGTAGMWATVREVSRDQAIVEIAYKLDWLDTQTTNELLKALGAGQGDARKPRWLKDRGELWFEAKIVRKIRATKRAKNVVAILSTFEDSSWPSQIDDPITSGGDSSTRRRVVETLNKDLKRIRFSCAGDGESFRWEILPERPRRKDAKKPASKKAAARAAKPAAAKRAAKKAR